MPPEHVLRIIGATITAGLGLMGLISPASAAKFTSISPVGKVGVSEIRATYGGFFLAMGVFALFSREPEVFITIGLGWAGAAAARLISVLVDRSFSPKNFGGIAFEAVIAWLLLAPRF